MVNALKVFLVALATVSMVTGLICQSCEEMYFDRMSGRTMIPLGPDFPRCDEPDGKVCQEEADACLDITLTTNFKIVQNKKVVRQVTNLKRHYKGCGEFTIKCKDVISQMGIEDIFAEEELAMYNVTIREEHISSCSLKVDTPRPEVNGTFSNSQTSILTVALSFMLLMSSA